MLIFLGGLSREDAPTPTRRIAGFQVSAFVGTKRPSRRFATADATHDEAIAQIYVHLPYYMQADLEEPSEDVCEHELELARARALCMKAATTAAPTNHARQKRRATLSRCQDIYVISAATFAQWLPRESRFP